MLHDTQVFGTLLLAASGEREDDFIWGIKNANKNASVLKKICVKDQEKLQKYILSEETVFRGLLSSGM
jgi:hypothetical protein